MNVDVVEYVNGLFEEKESELENKAQIYTILTHVTPEQEKKGWELVDKIKELRKMQEEFNKEAWG